VVFSPHFIRRGKGSEELAANRKIFPRRPVAQTINRNEGGGRDLFLFYVFTNDEKGVLNVVLIPTPQEWKGKETRGGRSKISQKKGWLSEPI